MSAHNKWFCFRAGHRHFLSFSFFLLPPQVQGEKIRKSALGKDEGKWNGVDSRGNGIPFSLYSRDSCTTPSEMCRSWVCLLVFVVAFVVLCSDTVAQHYSIALWPAIYYQDKKCIVNRAFNFLFTHFLLPYWCWTGLRLNLVRPELNHILENRR